MISMKKSNTRKRTNSFKVIRQLAGPSAIIFNDAINHGVSRSFKVVKWSNFQYLVAACELTKLGYNAKLVYNTSKRGYSCRLHVVEMLS